MSKLCGVSRWVSVPGPRRLGTGGWHDSESESESESVAGDRDSVTRRPSPRPSGTIIKPGYYYITLFLFPSRGCVLRIMTLLFFIMTILCHLFFCKWPDYLFSYFAYDTSIISLIFIRIDYCYFCQSHTIICIFLYLKLSLLFSFSNTILPILPLHRFKYFIVYD